jgi:hypothetical protein
MYVMLAEGNLLLKVDTSNIISILMGGAGTTLFDQGAASSASLNTANQITGDTTGRLYIADTFNFKVRVILLSSNIVYLVAGTGTDISDGNDMKATSATLSAPVGVWKDTVGNIYISESYRHNIRKIAATTNIITNYAGEQCSLLFLH